MVLEEPIQHQNLPLMAEMAKTLSFHLPPANAWLLNGNFRDLLNLRAASLLQPHITHCSGITKKAIATLAEAYYAESFRMQKSILLGDIASMHIMATVPNFVAHQIPNLQAAPTDKVQRSYLGKSYMKKPLVMTEGSIIIKKILMVPVWY